MELGGNDNGEDDEVEEKVKVRWCEASEEEVPNGRSFVEDEM